MKSWLKYLGLFFTLLLISSFAFAQTVTPVDPATLIPSWIPAILLSIKALPVVGPYVAIGLTWIGKIAATLGAVFTGLSVFVATLAVALQTLTSAVGWQSAADFIAKWNAVLQPWLKYFSVFNVDPNDPNHPAVAMGIKAKPDQSSLG